jgi:hypothetical protein
VCREEGRVEDECGAHGEKLQFYSIVDVIWQVIWVVKLTLHAKGKFEKSLVRVHATSVCSALASLFG